MMLRLSTMPSGKPTSVLIRASFMSLTDQCSSRPPEEKKITW